MLAQLAMVCADCCYQGVHGAVPTASDPCLPDRCGPHSCCYRRHCSSMPMHRAGLGCYTRYDGNGTWRSCSVRACWKELPVLEMEFAKLICTCGWEFFFHGSVLLHSVMNTLLWEIAVQIELGTVLLLLLLL